MRFRQRLSFWHGWQGGAVAALTSVLLLIATPYLPVNTFTLPVQQALVTLHTKRQEFYTHMRSAIYGTDWVYWRNQATTLQDELNEQRAMVAMLQADAVGRDLLQHNTGNAPTVLGRLVMLSAPDALSMVAIANAVAVQSAVTTPDGLWGRVISSSNTLAQVMPLSHSSSAVPVVNDTGQVRGLLLGRGHAPALLQFVTPQPLNVGELLLTSGDGGILPAGLPVGRVRSSAPNGVVLVDLLAHAVPNRLVGVHAPAMPPASDATPVDTAPPLLPR